MSLIVPSGLLAPNFLIMGQVSSELAFTPRNDAEFPPLRTMLSRQDRPCPLVIERFFPEEAKDLPPDLRDETVSRLATEEGKRGQPFFRVLRTFDGAAQAVSLNFLVRDAGAIRMRCDRTVKRDCDPATQIEGVALAFLVSAMLFMKSKGYWPDTGPILFNIIPRVADSLRERAGIDIPWYSSLGVAMDGFSARESEVFLKKAEAIRLERALPPPPAAAAEAVFVDGRPAG
jgi:hypothetical protein